MTRKWYATLRHPKMYPHTKFGIPTSKNIGDMDRTRKRDGRTDGRTDWRTDGRTDSAITICLPKFLWGHKKGYNIVWDFLETRIAKSLTSGTITSTWAFLLATSAELYISAANDATFQWNDPQSSNYQNYLMAWKAFWANINHLYRSNDKIVLITLLINLYATFTNLA